MQVKSPQALARLLSFSQGIPADDSRAIIELLAETGALLDGHFELQGGQHSQYFLRFSQLGWHPGAVRKIAAMLLERSAFAARATTIVCAETSSLFLAKAIQAATGKSLVVARVDGDRRPTKEIFIGKLPPGVATLVVSDIITTGQSLNPLIELAQCVGVSAFASRPSSSSLAEVLATGLEHSWLVSPTWMTSPPEHCPLCTNDSVPLLLAAEFN